MENNKSKVELMAEQVQQDIAEKEALLGTIADYRRVLEYVQSGTPAEAKSMTLGLSSRVMFPSLKETVEPTVDFNRLSAKTRRAYISAISGTIEDLQKAVDRIEAKYSKLLG